MNSHEASQAYLQASIENAPPLQIIKLLYQGALRFLGQAKQQSEMGDLIEFRNLCRQVEDIVVELRLALHFEPGSDESVPRNLERLYLFCEDELVRAQIENKTDPLDGVKRVLETLLDAWKNVELERDNAA